PSAIRYPRGAGVGAALSDEFSPLEIGKGEIVHKGKGEHKILVVAIGSMVHPALEAAKLAEKDGVGATVLNARFVKPLDRDLILREAKKADHIVTVEEGVLEGGFGSAVLELLAAEGIVKPVTRLGLPSKFIGHGKREYVLDRYGLTAVGIAKVISG
ncbi:MAG: transketolase C-terminal domain-containing protein, partial [Syntrophales bacterium]